MRDRLSIDLFCSGLVWLQVTRRLQFRQNDELKGEASRQWVRAIGLLDASLPALGAALDEWVLGFPEGYLAEKSDALAMGGMERLDRLRVASRRQLVFMEALPARMQLTPEQVVKLREAPVLLLPFRME